MKALRPQSYIWRLALAALALLLVAAGFNALVDPYRVTRLIDNAAFNLRKPHEWEYARVHKPFQLPRTGANAVIFGTSQIERGIDPEAPALSGSPLRLYNYGLSELRPYETALLLADAIAIGGVKTAIVSLDFAQYGIEGSGNAFLPADWNRNYARRDFARQQLSLTTLRHSIDTVDATFRTRPVLEHLPSGLLNVARFVKETGEPDVRDVFDSVNRVFLSGYYKPYIVNYARLRQFGFDHGELKRILAVARERGVQLHVIFPPRHATQLEIVAALGLMPLMEQMKAEIVCTIEKEGGNRTVRVWDFADYSRVTTEKVPARGAKQAMAWYTDPVHFITATGSLIVGRVAGIPVPELAALPDFGLELSGVGIKAHLEAIRVRRARFLELNPGFQQELAALGDPPERVAAQPPAPAPDCAGR